MYTKRGIIQLNITKTTKKMFTFSLFRIKTSTKEGAFSVTELNKFTLSTNGVFGTPSIPDHNHLYYMGLTGSGRNVRNLISARVRAWHVLSTQFCFKVDENNPIHI